MTARVYLVGAGPGDAGLVTVKGMELIKKADCILYDRLASAELLDYARPDCERIYVGKQESRHTMPQEDIQKLLVQKAKKYRTVVRLKGGDSFVFGRGGEECLYLKEHGIRYTVVPGVTSAVAAAECAGIPVTHRGVAESFRVVTAHRRRDGGDLDCSTMTDPAETLVFLMGASRVETIAKELLAAGRSERTPAAVISGAATPEQTVDTGTLASFASQSKEPAAPAVVVVGDVVALGEKIRSADEEPLHGLRCLVTRVGEAPSVLAALLRERGAAADECMTGRIEGIPAVYTKKELAASVLLFTSAHGVDYFMKNVFASGLDVRALSGSRFVVIGERTAQALKNYGVCADFIPQHADTKSLAKELHAYLEREFPDPFVRASVLYPAAKNADDELVDRLLPFCDCGRLNVYENVPCPVHPAARRYDAFFFTCASSAERLLAPLSEAERAAFLGDARVCSIGPKCTVALRALGVSRVTEAAEHTYKGMVESL